MEKTLNFERGRTANFKHQLDGNYGLKSGRRTFYIKISFKLAL